MDESKMTLYHHEIIILQESNEISSLGHGERILLKINQYLHLRMFANYLWNIATNTSKNSGNIALDIVLEVSLQEVQFHPDRELN